MADKPDLIDSFSQKGIEVTHPVDEKHEMLNSYYNNHLFGKPIDQIPPEGLKRFKAYSYDIMFDPQSQTVTAYKWPYRPFDMEIIYRAIDKKMRKLNSNLYTYSDNISLFLEMAMYSREFEDYSVAKEILNYYKRIKNNYSMSFKEIFLDCVMKLYRINVLNDEITEFDILDLMDSIECKYEENRTMEGAHS